ncbi:MAG: GtrA family protein [Gammaproteobacteria bacterium]|nr:GtrA family protein [Gammaproteobacteria bacterium]
MLNKEFVKFVFSGGLAAGANFFSRMLFSLVFNYPVSIVLAYLVGMTTAYLLFKFFVFQKGENSTQKQIGYFIFINLLAIILILITSLLCYKFVFSRLENVFWRESLSHLVGITVTTLSSYLGHKKLTFK